MDRKERYIHRMEYFKEHKSLCRALVVANKGVTYLVMLLYPVLLVWTFFHHPELLFKGVIVPLDSFILVTVFRYLVNKRRPYERYEHLPAVKKDTKGKSFPSRHVFSIFMIAMTFIYLYDYPQVGEGMLIVGILLALLRVLLGVHFVSDVVAGAGIGIIAGIIGFYIF